MENVRKVAVTMIQTVSGGVIGGFAGGYGAAAYSSGGQSGYKTEPQKEEKSWQVLKRKITREKLRALLEDTWGRDRDFNIIVSGSVSILSHLS